uniref:Interleukin-13 n=1 Tax=Felis catus TaxID=9685 RepID=A0ABI7ZM80_FELCA
AGSGPTIVLRSLVWPEERVGGESGQGWEACEQEPQQWPFIPSETLVRRLSLTEGPHSRRELKELIEELVNITQNQVSLCNGSMVWSVNLTTGMYCAALESLINVSDCTAIQRTQRMLKALCTQKPSAGQTASERSRDTKIEVIQLVKNLLNHLRRNFRHGNFK